MVGGRHEGIRLIVNIKSEYSPLPRSSFLLVLLGSPPQRYTKRRRQVHEVLQTSVNASGALKGGACTVM
jgi:hypothetical protein